MKSKYCFIALLFIIIITTIFAFEKKNIIENSIFTRFYQPIDTSQYDDCACKTNYSGCLAYYRDNKVEPNCYSSYGTTNSSDCINCKYCELCINKNGEPICVNKSDLNKVNCPFSFEPCNYYLKIFSLENAKFKCPYIKKNEVDFY